MRVRLRPVSSSGRVPKRPSERTRLPSMACPPPASPRHPLRQDVLSSPAVPVTGRDDDHTDHQPAAPNTPPTLRPASNGYSRKLGPDAAGVPPFRARACARGSVGVAGRTDSAFGSCHGQARRGRFLGESQKIAETVGASHTESRGNGPPGPCTRRATRSRHGARTPTKSIKPEKPKTKAAPLPQLSPSPGGAPKDQNRPTMAPTGGLFVLGRKIARKIADRGFGFSHGQAGIPLVLVPLGTRYWGTPVPST